MATCHTPGCNEYAPPNDADTENGPHERDLDPVYCDACYFAAEQDMHECFAALRALGFETHLIYFMPGSWPANIN